MKGIEYSKGKTTYIWIHLNIFEAAYFTQPDPFSVFLLSHVFNCTGHIFFVMDCWTIQLPLDLWNYLFVRNTNFRLSSPHLTNRSIQLVKGHMHDIEQLPKSKVKSNNSVSVWSFKQIGQKELLSSIFRCGLWSCFYFVHAMTNRLKFIGLKLRFIWKRDPHNIAANTQYCF